uniref:Sey1/RHD3-like three-helix bundle domain-containing protein n=1 Tax=Salix viminalis TaxID=40686 RepID=A0A6N2M984_SALVM
MDFEGTDSNQRGEDDAAFERQSTLFALEIADVVVQRHWSRTCSQQTLLKTVFQVIKRSSKQPKKTLLFVIRDHTKTPLERLKKFIFEDIEKQFVHSTCPGGLVGDRKKVKSASFSIYAEDIWKTIKENKDLDLPSLKRWLAIKEDVQTGPIPGFGEDVTSILETCLSEYDIEVGHFDQEVRNAKRKQLLSNKQITHAIANTVESLLEASERNTWASVRDVFECNTEKAISEFSDAAASFDLCSSEINTKFQQLREYARNLLEMKAREQADAGRIENVLYSSLMDRIVLNPSLQKTPMEAVLDPLALDTWEEVSQNSTTLLKPEDCESLWMTFIEEIKPMVTDVKSRQDARKKTRSYAAVAATGVAATGVAAVVAGPAGVVSLGIAVFRRAIMRM